MRTILRLLSAERHSKGSPRRSLRTGLIRSLGLIGSGLLTLLPCEVHATALQMDVHIGFDGRFLVDTWTPVTVLIQNRGAGIEAALEVVAATGSEYRKDVRATTYVISVELPSQARKQFSFSVHLDNAVHPLLIRIVRDRQVLLSRSINLRAHVVDSPMVLMMGGGPVDDLGGWVGRAIHTAWPQPDFLPQRWYGYDGVAAMIIDSRRLVELPPACFEALVQWVSRGGLLVLSGGPDFGALQTTRVQRLIPLRVSGLRRAQAVQTLASLYDEDPEPFEPLPAVQVEAPGATVLVAEQGHPLVMKGGLGMGEVVFTAFDVLGPPFTHWPGRARLWQTLLARHAGEARPALFPDRTIFDALARSHPARFASWAAGAAFCLVIIFFGLGLHRLMARWKERRAGLLVVWLVGLGLVGLVGSRLFACLPAARDPYLTGFMHLRWTGPSQAAAGMVYLGIFGVRPGTHEPLPDDLVFPVVAAGAVRGRDEPAPAMTLIQQQDRQTVSIDLPRWSHRFMKIADFFPPPVEISTSQQGPDVRVTLRNRTRHALEHVQGLRAGRIYDWGRIAPGSTAVKTIEANDASAPARPSMPATGKDAAGSSLMEDLRKLSAEHAQSALRPDADRLLVRGWIAAATLRPDWHARKEIEQGAAFFEWLAPEAPQ